jgi:ribonuclease Y
VESEEVVNGVASHHNDVSVGPLEFCERSGAISAASGGAVREHDHPSETRRCPEKLGNAPGVENALPQAGELRVLFNRKSSTMRMPLPCSEYWAKIESELQYPGQIRITVIRETRCVEIAK